MSRHVHSLKVGDTIDIKGPFEKYNWDKKPVDQVGMVAGKSIYDRSLIKKKLIYMYV